MVDKIILLSIGFMLTTVFGGILGFLLNRKLWKTQTEHTIYRASFDEGTKFLDELSALVGRRFFLLQRFLWAIQEQDTDKVENREKEYFECVKEWNSTYWRSRNKIRLLVSDIQASKFLDYEDDTAGENPKSLHYTFVIVHRTVMAFKSGAAKSKDAEPAVVRLNWTCSVFLEQLTSEFVRGAAALQLLHTPTSPGGAELAAARRFKSFDGDRTAGSREGTASHKLRFRRYRLWRFRSG